MLLFGVTTRLSVRQFAMVQFCGVGQRRWFFLGVKELGCADHHFLA
jgi:hypothetical protein